MILVHPTWLELKPNENYDGNQENFIEYYERVISSKFELGSFPKEVYEQWIHPHHKNFDTLKNYSWIDYGLIEFEKVFWNIESIESVNVIERAQSYVNLRASYNEFNEFCCKSEDLEYWKSCGTWRTPPIILDVNSLNDELPNWSELRKPYQLVEGHSRLGYLKSMNKIKSGGSYKMADKHILFLMKKRGIEKQDKKL
jgi:hypothetical protein|tara:strand:+ start:99 stop:692 length:594 start_codon:yes stop_codon:yes gene_type:complete